MLIKIIGKNYESDILTVQTGQEEAVSQKVMELQENGVEELQIVELVERDITDQFVLRFVEKTDGTKMVFGTGNQPSFVSKYQLRVCKQKINGMGSGVGIGSGVIDVPWVIRSEPQNVQILSLNEENRD